MPRAISLWIYDVTSILEGIRRKKGQELGGGISEK
jgi:hypothetical protein